MNLNDDDSKILFPPPADTNEEDLYFQQMGR